MARTHVMTEKRRAALRKAQKASARKRRRRGFVKSEVQHFANKRGKGRQVKAVMGIATAVKGFHKNLKRLRKK